MGAGQGLAPGMGSSIGAGATPIGAGSVGLTAGTGAGLAPGIGASLGAGAGTIGAGSLGLKVPSGAITPSLAIPGYTGTNVPTDIFSKPTFPGSPTAGPSSTSIPSWSTEGVFKTPTMPAGGGGGPTATTGPSFIDDIISTGKDVLGKVNKVTGPLQDIANLTDALMGKQQQQVTTSGRPAAFRNPAELFPVTNIMMSPEEIEARRTTRPTFVGGLGAMRNLT